MIFQYKPTSDFLQPYHKTQLVYILQGIQNDIIKLKHYGKNKKSVIAIINGIEAKIIGEVLLKLPLESRNKVKEISLDMAPNMALTSRNCFTKSNLVIDHFHVVRLVCDSIQHLPTQLRWKVIDNENEAIKKAKKQGLKYKAEILTNGDTLRELLVRSKYLLYKYEND